MTKSTVTEKELADAQCYDFSIQTLPDGKDFLILICKDKEQGNKLLDILSHNAFDLRIIVDEKTGIYSLDFHFIEAGIAFRFDTGRDETKYPPLLKLKNKQIKFITTGVWTGRSEQGRMAEYNGSLMRLGLFDIGESLAQADEVKFIAGDSEKEPSIVLMIYKDYDHIYAAEANEGYNKLKDLAISRPILEIAPIDAETVDLRIWDILLDLDVRILGLKYSEDQLKEFIAKTGASNSFAFALGFPPLNGEKAVIASTQREGFEIITLKGYVVKESLGLPLEPDDI